jgi:hypothetical protein
MKVIVSIFDIVWNEPENNLPSEIEVSVDQSEIEEYKNDWGTYDYDSFIYDTLDRLYPNKNVKEFDYELCI